MTDVPFGFDDVKPTDDVPEGTWLCVISSKTSAQISRAGNPMLRIWFTPIDPELPSNARYWPVRKYYVLRGEGAGMFHNVLSSLGENPDEYMAEKQSIYDGDNSSESVADFFGAAVVPELLNREIRVRVTHVPATYDDGSPVISDETGEQRINAEVVRTYPV